MLNGMRDGVTVGWAEDECLKDQHIEGSLQHLTLKRGFAPWHVFNILHSMVYPKSISDIR
jgi:hypothetical protein